MIEEKKIEQLLSAFYKGDTTPREEELLAQFFSSNEVSEKWHTDRDVFAAIYDPSRISIPAGISERLELAIDKHMEETALPSRSKVSITRKFYITIISTAAAAILCIGLFFYFDRRINRDFIADTYTNPEEAAIAAEQALLFISAKLNQGLAPLEKVKNNVDKTNEILNENLKLY